MHTVPIVGVGYTVPIVTDQAKFRRCGEILTSDEIEQLKNFDLISLEKDSEIFMGPIEWIGGGAFLLCLSDTDITVYTNEENTIYRIEPII